MVLGEIGQDRLKMARLRHCGSSGGKVVLEIRQERQETNWKLEGGAFCTSRLQSGGKGFTWWRSFWAEEEQMAQRPGRGTQSWGNFNQYDGQRCFEAGLHIKQKNTVDARKEETFNKNGMTTAKT